MQRYKLAIAQSNWQKKDALRRLLCYITLLAINGPKPITKTSFFLCGKAADRKGLTAPAATPKAYQKSLEKRNPTVRGLARTP